MFAKNVFNISGVFIAVILGAGFASGQELLTFFITYGKIGFAGIMAAGIIFGLVGWAVLELCYSNGIKTYGGFLELIMGKVLATVMETMVAVFLFVLFSTMLAATGAIAREFFGISFSQGALIMTIICFFTFIFGLDALVKINTILAPIMILGGIFVGIFAYYTQVMPTFKIFSLREERWLISALVYASYNIITLITVLATLHKFVHSKKSAFWGAALGSMAITLLGFCISLPLFLNSHITAEIPILQILMEHSTLISWFYVSVLVIAIYTTAACNGHAFCQWMSIKFKVSNLLAQISICVTAFLAAHLGFSTFVSKIYPLFGYVGMFEILVILLFFIIYKINIPVGKKNSRFNYAKE